MDNAGEEISNRPRTVYANAGSTGKTTTTKKLFAMNDYKINYRYERWGHSELAVACALIDENGDIKITLFDNQGGKWEEEKATIFKSSIGNMHWNQWRSITELEYQVTDLEPFNSNALVWNTFERDYAKSPLPLGDYTANGTTVYISGRRTYANEWYTHDGIKYVNGNVVSKTIPPLDFNYIWAAWSKAHVNYKSDIRIWRSGGI